MADPNWAEKGSIVRKDTRTEGGLLGIGGYQVNRVTFENGETWDIPDDENKAPNLVDFDTGIANAWRQANKQTAPTTRQAPDDNEYQWDPDQQQWLPAPGMPQTRAVDPEDEALRRRLLAAQVASAERGPAGRQIMPWEEQQGWLNVQKTQQSLMSPALLYQKQTDEAIQNLAQKYVNGEISLQERDQQMKQLQDSFNASIQGTTPFQKQQQREKIASDVLGNRLQTGNSMAQGLISGANNAFSKIYSSTNPNYNFNPFDTTKAFLDAMGSGQDMSDLAKSVIMGSLQNKQGGLGG